MPFEVQHQVDLPTDTLLKAKLIELDNREVPFADKKTGEQKTFNKLKWVFEITQDGEYLGKTVQADTSAYLSDSPHNQFRNWAEQLLNRELETGQILSESDLIGLPAMITVRYEEDRKDKTKKYARVEDVLAAGDSFAEPPF